MSNPIPSSSGKGYNPNIHAIPTPNSTNQSQDREYAVGNQLTSPGSSTGQKTTDVAAQSLSPNQSQDTEYAVGNELTSPGSSTCKKTTDVAAQSLSPNPNYSANSANLANNSGYNCQDDSNFWGSNSDEHKATESPRIQGVPFPVPPLSVLPASSSSLSPRATLRILDPMYQKLNALKAEINQQLGQMQLPACISPPTIDQLECEPKHVSLVHKNTEGFVILYEDRNSTFDVIGAIRSDAELDSLQIPKSTLNGKDIAWLPRYVILSEADQHFLKINEGLVISVCWISSGRNQKVIKDNVAYLYLPRQRIVCKVDISVEESESGPQRKLDKDSSGRVIARQIVFINQNEAEPMEVLLNAFYPPR